jgi:enoyl-CoA hydratase/carnithine racemase
VTTLERDGEVYILDLGDTENRFHPDWLVEVQGQLETVASADGPRALVTTATGKYFSNGLDLDWLAQHTDELSSYVLQIHGLFARVLSLPVPTVAAIQGHCFAGGAMLSLAHDFRVMRADRGFFCLPEVDINIPFTRGMAALIQSRLSKQVAHEAMTTGRRYGGTDAQGKAIVDAAVAESGLLGAALEIARPLAGKAGPTLGTIKARMYADALATLRDADSPLD